MALLTTYLTADVINGVTICDVDEISDNQCLIEWEFYESLKDTDKPIYGLVSDGLLNLINQEYGVR